MKKFSYHSDVFGTLPTGENIQRHQLENAQGTIVTLMNYGATLLSLTVPDKSGQPVGLTLGFDNLAAYLNHPYYFGCTIGRVANRIAHGCLRHQDTLFQLTCNENPVSHLHGGDIGFDKVIWEATALTTENTVGVRFSHRSPDRTEGYPGNLTVTVTYQLSDDNDLKISYFATTDQPTAVSLTNHTYWNLAGNGTILDHVLQIDADRYLETDSHLLPTGKICPVAGTAYDFLQPRRIGDGMTQVAGYDNYYILTPGSVAARLVDPASGRELEIETTQPGLQFYSGNYLQTGSLSHDRQLTRWAGLCLETQGFPDAVNHANFPTIILLPENTYAHETRFRLR
jgi:aldose 1-epimerase